MTTGLEELVFTLYLPYLCTLTTPMPPPLTSMHTQVLLQRHSAVCGQPLSVGGGDGITGGCHLAALPAPPDAWCVRVLGAGWPLAVCSRS